MSLENIDDGGRIEDKRFGEDEVTSVKKMDQVRMVGVAVMDIIHSKMDECDSLRRDHRIRRSGRGDGLRKVKGEDI